MRIRKVDASLDRRVITGMIVSDEFLAGIILIYKPEYLLTPFAITIAYWCLDYYKKYKKAPGKHIQDIFKSKEQDGLPDAQVEEIEQFLFNLSEDYKQAEKFEVNFLLDQARKEFEKRSLKILTEDIDAYLSRGEIEEAEKVRESYKPLTKSTRKGTTKTLEELMEMELQEIRWIIDGVIPEGLTLFAGKPKVGKSFFLFNAALSVAAGSDAFGSIPTEQAKVLYLALEDPDKRITHRFSNMLDKQPELKSASKYLRFKFIGECPFMHQGGMEELEKEMEENPEIRLIIIDTLERFKEPQKNPGYHYSADAQSLIPLQEFANKHQIAVVVAHHTKKADMKDEFDEISGTTGLTGVADMLALLKMLPAGRKDGRVLSLRGRDSEAEVLSFRFEDGLYSLIEDEAERYQGSDSRRAIIHFLNLWGEPISRKELVDVMENNGVGKGVDTLLAKLARDGEIQKIGYGIYAHKKYRDYSDIWQKAHNRINGKRRAARN